VGLKADPNALQPSTIRDKARGFAIQEVAAQKEEFRSLGIMADWDNEKATYRTLGASQGAHLRTSSSFAVTRSAVRDAPIKGIPEDGGQR
jgi:hypothetical protein